MESLLQESTRSRNELKSRAQEAVCQWRAKVRRLQKELEDARAQGRLHEDQALQVGPSLSHTVYRDRCTCQISTSGTIIGSHCFIRTKWTLTTTVTARYM